MNRERNIHKNPSLSIVITFTLLILFIQLSLAAISENEVEQIAQNNDHGDFVRLLKRLVKPRVVGSKGHRNVQQFIINELKALDFDVELDSFSQNVPIFNNLTFTNIIGRSNPNAEEYIALACHYDSKFLKEGAFQAATDSAVPCAIMLNTVRTLRNSHPDLLSTNKSDISLMLIFFDGEEAFENWTENDSLYGSRHLAKTWHDRQLIRGTKGAKEIDRITVLILLDLIGGANPKFRSFFSNTETLHDRLVQIERHLGEKKVLQSNSFIFLRQIGYGGVDDDHVPFLTRNVPVLHLISTPFPDTWHTLGDNLKNVDMQSVKQFNMVFRPFLADFLTAHHTGDTYRTLPFQ